MTYVAAKGGRQAIEQAERLFRAEIGTIDRNRVMMLRDTQPYLIDRLMGEASLYAPDLAALALAQSGGDLAEAVLLLRAFRTTQPRIAYAEPISSDHSKCIRRISAAYKDLPGGQFLGPSLDYTHRILKTEILTGDEFSPEPVEPSASSTLSPTPLLVEYLRDEGLLAPKKPGQEIAGEDIPDVTREAIRFPATRPHTLQSLARADTGAAMGLGYAAVRGYGALHPTVGELRLNYSDIRIPHPNGNMFSIGRIKTSHCDVINPQHEDKEKKPLELGFSATLGWNETKVISSATLDLAMRASDPHPAITQEFVISHTEAVEASGFCLHFKLPHYVHFQSTLDAERSASVAHQKSDVNSTSETLLVAGVVK